MFVLGYRNDDLFFENEIDTDSREFATVAAGIRNRLDFSRVVIINDGEVAADTNGMG
jgi:hypothetical protein